MYRGRRHICSFYKGKSLGIRHPKAPKIETTQPQKSRLSTYSSLLVVAIPALLYFYGWADHVTYLAKFGLDKGMFPLNFHEAIIRGFIAIFGGLAVLMNTGWVAWLFFVELVLMVVLWESIKHVKESLAGPIPEYVKQDWSEPKRTIVSYVQKTIRFITILFAVVLLYYLFRLSLAFSFSFMKENVDRQMATMKTVLSGTMKPSEYRDSEHKIVSVLYQKQDGSATEEIEKGVIALANVHYCAIYLQDSTIVIPKDRIYSINVLYNYSGCADDSTLSKK